MPGKRVKNQNKRKALEEAAKKCRDDEQQYLGLKKIPHQTLNKTPIDYKIVDALLQRGARRDFVAATVELCPDRLTDRIKEDKGMTFEEYRKHQLQKTEASMLGNMFGLTKNTHGSVSFKANQYILRHLCGFTEKLEVNSVNTSVSYEDYLAHLDKLGD
jgi:hypothetical protein